jgi:enoyl-CoA hydratase/carnithine racemase
MSVRTAVADGVAIIEMRAARGNAMTLQMFDALSDAIGAAVVDETVHALLLAGRPDVFSTGADVKEFMQDTAGRESPHRAGLPLGWATSVARLAGLLLDCDRPLVAAVNGTAAHVGMAILLHCDLVYVSDDAQLSVPFAAFAGVPLFASSLLMSQLMGHAKAAEMLLLGKPVSGAEAVECGLANAVLPADEVLVHARRVAERFNGLPLAAVRENKRLMRKARAKVVMSAMRDEGAAASARVHSPEVREWAMAFFEKRRPDYSKF